MDARTMRKYGSPERSRPWVEPPMKLLPGMKIPVVYYLCRNRHLEHPHFMEVPLSSSDGLYLRDVIDRLNGLRGRGMAAMYSWSCKRSYKNGFVWHDLLEDDLVVPVHGNEYVLKGSELLDRSPGVNNGGGSTRDAQLVEPSPSPPSSSSSPPSVVIKEAKSPSSEVKLRVCKPTGAQDAATQTENDDSVSLKPKRCSEIEEEVSPPPPSSSSSGGKTGTLESLIRAEARMNGFRFLEDDQVLVSARTRLKAANVFMHLITCGSISVKEHHNFGLVHSYKPGFSRAKFSSPQQLDCYSDNPRVMGLRLEDKEYFSGSLVETKRHTETSGDGVPTLKRSSSYNADRKRRSCKLLDTRKERDKVVDSSRSNCLPRTIKAASSKQSRNETMRSPIPNATVMSSAVLDCGKASPNCSSRGASKRITDYASSLKGSSSRFESFREDKEKVIVIEERLTSGARVIIQSTVPCDISEDSSDSG